VECGAASLRGFSAHKFNEVTPQDYCSLRRTWPACRLYSTSDMLTKKGAASQKSRVPMPVSSRWKIPEAAPRPVLQKDSSQQEVQAYSLVRSPMMMHPGSQLAAHRRSKDHILGELVEFSVLVV